MPTWFFEFVFGFFPPVESKQMVNAFLPSVPSSGKAIQKLSFSTLLRLTREKSFHLVKANKVTELSLEQSGPLSRMARY